MQTGEFEEMEKRGSPPSPLNSSNENDALFALSLETEMIVVPTINLCDALPFPVVGSSPGAFGLTVIDMPAAKLKSLLFVQKIWPAGAFIITLVKPGNEVLTETLSVPLTVSTPDWLVMVLAFTVLPAATV